MRTATGASAALALAACAIGGPEPQETEAVYDYVSANELKEVDSIRRDREMRYSYVSDRFVIIPTRRGDYLAEFRADCDELGRTDWPPERPGPRDLTQLEMSDRVDRRSDTNVLRTKTGTIRGCTIGRMYEITDAQRKELQALGDAPGDEVFLPEEED